MLVFSTFLSAGMYRGHNNDSLSPSFGYIVLAAIIVFFLIYEFFKKRK